MYELHQQIRSVDGKTFEILNLTILIECSQKSAIKIAIFLKKRPKTLLAM